MVKKSIEAKVRPLANASLEKASLQGAARLYVSKDSIISLTGSLDCGGLCIVEKIADGASITSGKDVIEKDVSAKDDQQPLKREGALWVLPDKNVSPNVVMMSRAFQDATGFKIGDQVRLSMSDAQTPDASEVVVKDTTEGSEEDPPQFQRSAWQTAISMSLERAVQAFPGMVLDGVNLSKSRRSFKVLSVDSKTHNLANIKAESLLVRVIQASEDESAAEGPQIGEAGGELRLTTVPGLGTEVNVINKLLRVITKPAITLPKTDPTCGFVIYGGHGTGKTFIIDQLAATNWGNVHYIKPSDKITAVRETFKQAQMQQPSMILIDGLQDLVKRFDERTGSESALIDTISSEMKAISNTAKRNGGRSHIVVVATCLDYLSDVPRGLQSRTCLLKKVLLPLPRAPERLEILRYYVPPSALENHEECLKDIADKTHAYTGKDLYDLVGNALDTRIEALDSSDRPNDNPEAELLTPRDFEQALRLTPPTAMQGVSLRPPTIHWKDVGGQDSVKKILTRMITYAKDNDPSKPRVVTPSKGLLLYGPPGCSKTLSAQAMATEASFNFFAVKGAELLNMYVGESERGIRNLFSHARAAAPSIIFFDEIDSIGGQRAGNGGGGGASSTSGKSSGSVNMITTLLTEMDGFEALSGVIVIAATNRPEQMDEALLRPGRFDEIVYVGPPDLAAREAIFRVHLRNKPLAEDVDIPQLAARSDGHSGAEIKNICNKAAHTVQSRYDEGNDEKLEFRMEDLEAALLHEPTRITSQMISGYENWSRQFRQL